MKVLKLTSFYLRRYLEIAKRGDHTLLIITDDPSFVSTQVDYPKAYIDTPCPCGFYLSSQNPCECSVEEIKEHRKRIPFYYDIHCLVVDIPFIDLEINMDLDNECLQLLGEIYEKKRLLPSQLERILKVTKTIAELEKDKVRNVHIFEAVEYVTNLKEKLHF